MCGRFTLTTPGDVLAEAFGLDEAPQASPRFNIAPTQAVLAVRREGPDSGRRAVLFRWGLVTPRSREGERPLINARAETADELPSFSQALRRRRCLVPADGFYEWQAVPGSRRRQPVYVRMADRGPFAFAALWEPATRPVPGGETTVGSCTILTTDPNGLLAPIHDRMPVILPPEAYSPWLDPSVDEAGALRSLFAAFPADRMTAYPVGPSVNDPRNETPDCLRPLLV